jgi:hypothetical protein
LRRNIQHYRCQNCNKQFQNKRRKQKLEQKIFSDHVWKRQTVTDLKITYKKGEHTIRRILDRISVHKSSPPETKNVVLIFDATHLGADLLLVARSPHQKKNVGFAWILEETKENYSLLKQDIERRGYHLLAIVLDGRTGIPGVFDGIPLQICQFHMLQIVRRKLTLRPETEAGKELLTIGLNIVKYNEDVLQRDLNIWYTKYEKFLQEKTYILGSKRWRYTHRRVRSAYASLKKNILNLFTYQKYPELNIPNTTNSLDGFFSRLKNLLSAHRGKSQERIRKIVTEILRK